ncbi:MAG: translation elongation factor Ts [Anaerolineales bacterium]|nr:translation elongation factor Ts [Anaerolineales bacterium]
MPRQRLRNRDMAISAQLIKELREKTQAGILDCRKALEASDGDLKKAERFLLEKGLAAAAKRADREASNGVIELYSHGDGRLGVMVEINCETDFVARTEGFRSFAHEIALQVAASDPSWLREEDIPEAILADQKDIARKRVLEEGKPEQVIDRIIEGRLKKFLDEACLLNQIYIKDEEKTVDQILKEIIATTGENIVIRRFERWSLGEAETK